MKVHITLVDGDVVELETDAFEVSRSGTLALYKNTGPGLHREITHLYADGHWLRVIRLP